MKILHIINSLPCGGAEKLIEKMLPVFNECKDVEADVLLLTDNENVLDEYLIRENVKVDTVAINKTTSLFNIPYLRRYISKGNYDIVHAHLFPAFYWTSLAAKSMLKNKPRFLLTEHNTHNRRRGKLFFRFIEKFIYSSFDKVISVSEETQKNLLKWLKIKKEELDKFTVIENGLDLEYFAAAAGYEKREIDPELREEHKLICMAGSFSKQKDQAAIIKAMKELPENIHLLLIGEGELKEKNKKLAEKTGVFNRVHFSSGFRNDINRIFKTADVIVLSSKWEGFGLVAAEGMAAGKPVIASEVPGLKETVGNAGLLFPAGDSKKLSEIINKLLTNRHEYRKRAELCFERAQIFDIKKTAAGYMREYKHLA